MPTAESTSQRVVWQVNQDRRNQAGRVPPFGRSCESTGRLQRDGSRKFLSVPRSLRLRTHCRLHPSNALRLTCRCCDASRIRACRACAAPLDYCVRIAVLLYVSRAIIAMSHHCRYSSRPIERNGRWRIEFGRDQLLLHDAPHCARAYTGFPRSRVDRFSFAQRALTAASIREQPKVLPRTCPARPCQTGLYSLLDHRPLEFGEHAAHSKERLAATVIAPIIAVRPFAEVSRVRLQHGRVVRLGASSIF